MFKIKNLKKIPTESGYIHKFLNKEDDTFIDFGEVYFSVLTNNYPRPIKSHLLMTMNLTVVEGKIDFKFFNEQNDTEIVNLCSDFPQLLTVYPKIRFSFKKISRGTAIICNLSNIKHRESEVSRK